MLVSLSFRAMAQVTIFPEIDDMKHSKRVEIMKVELTGDFTIIDLYYAPMSTETSTEGDWICVDKQSYIKPTNLEVRKYLIMAKDITICPRSTKVTTTERDELIYQLYFPPLEPGIYKIDVIEKQKGGMNFYGVHINNRRNRSAADSAPFRSQEAFMKYFYDHRAQLDKIEGLWKLEIRHQHFYHQDRYMEELSVEPQVVAIIKKGDRFITYGEHGDNREESFSKLTGKKGYFFRKEIPEVESEASGYIVFSNSDQFFIKYALPDRLAHYYLLKDYTPGDKLYEIAKYTRIPVEKPKEKEDILDIGKNGKAMRR